MPLSVAAERVFPDEKSYYVGEFLYRTSGQWKRWQVQHVVRDDELVEHWEEVGDADPLKDKNTEFQFFALGEHTVGECRDIAEKLRGDYYWQQRLGEIRDSSTLVRDAIEYAEVRHKAQNRQSVIGPGIWQQRNW